MPRYALASFATLILAILTFAGREKAEPSSGAPAQEGTAAKPSDLAAALTFELPTPAGAIPSNWDGGPSGTIFTDDKVVHGGLGSARMERHEDSPSSFSSTTKSIPVDFSGAKVAATSAPKT